MSVTLFALLFAFQTVLCGTNLHYDDNIDFKFEEVKFDSSTLHIKEAPNDTIVNFNDKTWCVIPNPIKNTTRKYSRLSPAVIDDILGRHDCSSLNSGYWIYEICHGNRARQYHEGEKKLKHEKLNYIGYASDNILAGEVPAASEEDGRILRQFEGSNFFPHVFVLVNYTDGDTCLSSGVPRYALVYYVCFQNDEPNIIHFQEINTCAYRFVVGIKELCLFEKSSRELNILRCYKDSIGDRMPEIKADADMNMVDLIKLIQNSFNFTDGKIMESAGNSLLEKHFKETFFAGELCMTGANVYWTFVFCYGQSVSQYHVTEAGDHVTNSLGEYYPTSPATTHSSDNANLILTHEYTNGSECGDSMRTTTVYMFCNRELAPDAYSLEMYESEPCIYTLQVVSPLFCSDN